jgi:hypothetical protein
MKKILAIAVAAAVLGMGVTSFADLGSTLQNATNKAANKAVEEGAKKAVEKISGKDNKAATPAAEEPKTAKTSKKKAK